MRRYRYLAAGLGILICAVTARSQPLASRPSAPLAGLPSPAGEHVAKIAAMGNDAWLDLPKPAPDPVWGTPRGRSWCAKMAFDPHLQVGFLFGEGVHGWWNKETGRYMDDLWAYDLNANRWICIYPGADTKNLDLKLNEHGIETRQNGEPLPVAQMVHGYEGTTFDTDRHRFLFMPCSGGYWEAAMGERRMKWLDEKSNEVAKNCSPWMYDTVANRWERKPTPAPSARGGFGDVLIYVPTVKKVFLRHHPDVWWYDPAKNEWTHVEPKGPPPPFGIDPTACYDRKRDRIYMGGGSYPVADGPNALWIYDVRTDTWIDPKPAGTCCGGSNSYNSNVATMTYDEANDVVVLNRHKSEPGKGEAGLWIYDPARNAWDTHARPFTETPQGWKGQVNAFYDPQLNVHVYHIAGDSQPDGSIRLYRWKPAARR